VSKKKHQEPMWMPPIQPPPFASKHAAREAGYSVQPMRAGDWAVFARNKVTDKRSNSERGAWALLLGAQ